jgi:hypothetical protein
VTQPGRKLVTFYASEDMLRDITIAATATNRSIAEEVETRLMALRLIEESMRILKGMHSHAINGEQSKT